MENAPKSLRLHIGIFGRTNVGKSSFLNYVAGQNVAITSHVPGTTTDVVEKTMELLPLGPVVFMDTAGLDDVSILAEKRILKTKKVFDRSDIVILITEPQKWGPHEMDIVEEVTARKIPLIIVINKIDVEVPQKGFLENLKIKSNRVLYCSCVDDNYREEFLSTLKKALIDMAPENFLSPPPLVGDLLPAGGLAVLIVPIDLQAPKGRLIMPQVQTIRDALDHDAACLIVKEREYAEMLKRLNRPPDLVICDSQVVLKMTADTPTNIRCTTFSILFARAKGDLVEAARGAAVIPQLGKGDKVLVAESCSHHPVEDDIGRVKIPRWLTRFVGAELQIDVTSGFDYPENLKEYKLILHCGGCMLNRRHMLSRVQQARAAGVAITNYGVAISAMHGVAERVLAPFPAALAAYQNKTEQNRLEV